ncbi:hypothetical protein ACFWP3_41680 [Streptomyces sp. NPDC058525]|uniref:hypothetical protein n=1 Tax=Streptomyces sp. NPDC058525 TaxID=3346538 RepID=UPI00365780B9
MAFDQLEGQLLGPSLLGLLRVQVDLGGLAGEHGYEVSLHGGEPLVEVLVAIVENQESKLPKAPWIGSGLRG